MGFPIKARGTHWYGENHLTVSVELEHPRADEATTDRPRVFTNPEPGHRMVRCPKGHIVADVHPRTELAWWVQPADGYPWGDLDKELPGPAYRQVGPGVWVRREVSSFCPPFKFRDQTPIETACACGTIWLLDPNRLRELSLAHRWSVVVTEVEAAGIEPESFDYRRADRR